MNMHVTIDEFAAKFANQTRNLRGIDAINARQRAIYDVKVNTFNITTMAAITAITLSILSGLNTFFLVTGLILWGVRTVVASDLNRLNFEQMNEDRRLEFIFERMAGLTRPNNEKDIERVRQHFNLNERQMPAGWVPDAVSVFEVILWKNGAPTPLPDMA